MPGWILRYVRAFGTIVVLGSVSLSCAAHAPDGKNTLAGARPQRRDDLGSPLPIFAKDPVLGPADAPVTVVLFGGIRCEATSVLARNLTRIRDSANVPGVRFVWKGVVDSDSSTPGDADAVGRKVFAFGGDELFWKFWMRAALAPPSAGLDTIEALATGLGVPAHELRANSDPSVDPNVELAKTAGAVGCLYPLVNGVPAYTLDPERLADAIERQYRETEEISRTGVSASGLSALATTRNWKPKASEDQTAGAKHDTVYRIPVDSSPTQGPSDALVTIVVFSDLQCPFCSRLANALGKLRTRYPRDVRIVFKHHPMSFHAQAEPALAVALEASRQRGGAAFWEAHDALFRLFDSSRERYKHPLNTDQILRIGLERGMDATVLGRAIARVQPLGVDAWDRDYAKAAGREGLSEPAVRSMLASLRARASAVSDSDLLRVGSALGLDGKSVETAMGQGVYDDIVDRDLALGRALGVGGVPASFVNGRRIDGANLRRLEKLVDEELAAARAHVARGIARSDVGEFVTKGGVTPVLAPVPRHESKIVPIPAGAPATGPLRARVTVQVFGGYECPFTGRAVRSVERLKRAYGDSIRVVWRELPLSIHENARAAAVAGREVLRQRGRDAFWKFHSKLFSDQKGLYLPVLERALSESNVDVSEFRKALEDGRHSAAIDADVAAAAAAGFTGTPVLVINGVVIQGAQPYRVFTKEVNRALRGR